MYKGNDLRPVVTNNISDGDNNNGEQSYIPYILDPANEVKYSIQSCECRDDWLRNKQP